jgi:hypothetical protein
MQIGDRVEVIGDANDELLGKIGTVTDIVVMEIESAFCPSGWRSATAEDFRRSKLPEPPHFTYSHILPDDLKRLLDQCQTEIYFRVQFDVPSILPNWNGNRRELIEYDVYMEESLRLIAAAEDEAEATVP